MRIEETTIFSNCRQSLYTEAGYEVLDNDAHIIYDAIFGGMTAFLANAKTSGSKGAALCFRDSKGNFKLGGRVVVNEPEATDKEQMGNFSYEMSFYETDILNDDIDKHYDYTDMPVQTTIAVFIENEFRVRLSNSYILTQMIPTAIQTLLNWLDENAKDKEVELEIGKYAVATAIIEKGKKIFTITPSAEMKQMIKDDDAIAAKAS